MIYKAKILPDHLPLNFRCYNSTVPLIVEHNIYADKIGTVKIGENNIAEIDSDDERVKPGTKLSAGSFIMENNEHMVREVSITMSPRFADCEILEVIK